MAGQPVQLADLIALGISYRKLDFWTSRGWLRSTEPHPGTGRQRAWLPGEAEIAEVMHLLTSAGISPQNAHEAARNGGWLSDRVRVLVEPQSVVQAA